MKKAEMSTAVVTVIIATVVIILLLVFFSGKLSLIFTGSGA